MIGIILIVRVCQRRRRGKSTDKDRIKGKEWEKESEKRENLDGEGRSHGVAVRWRGLIERVFPRHTREKFFRQDKLLFPLGVLRWKLGRARKLS